MSRVNVLRSVGLGLTVAVFVVGALLIGQEAADPAANARETLRSYYANVDTAAVADRIVPGSLGQEVPREQLEAGLSGLLQGPFEVERTSTHRIRGIEVARVVVARPQGGQPIEWCVLPDGGLLLGCRLGGAELSAEVTGDAPIDVDFAGVDVLADDVQLAVVLVATGDEEVPLGEVRLEGGDHSLANTTYLLGGQQVPAEPDDLRVRPGAGLLLVWVAEGVEDVTEHVEGPFTVTWADGEIELTLNEMQWYVGPGADTTDGVDGDQTDGAPTPAVTATPTS